MKPVDKGEREENQNDLVLDYLAVRRFVGGIGLALPCLLILYSLISDKGILQNSISLYYYTGGREILVGSLCAIGVFLYSYRGYRDDPRWPSDMLVSRVAAIAAIGVAFFPTGDFDPSNDACTWLQCLIGANTKFLHYGSALIFFLALAVMCLVNFRRSAVGDTPNAKRRELNAIFRLCGILILLALVCIIAGFVFTIGGSFVFWAEAIGIWAFGLSWALKGETLSATRAFLRRVRNT